MSSSRKRGKSTENSWAGRLWAGFRLSKLKNYLISVKYILIWGSTQKIRFLPLKIASLRTHNCMKSTPRFTANMDLLKSVPVEILLNFENYFRTLQLGFWKFLSGIMFLHYYVRTLGLFFSQAHSIWPKPRAFNFDRKSMGTPTFYCGLKLNEQFSAPKVRGFFRHKFLSLKKGFQIFINVPLLFFKK